MVVSARGQAKCVKVLLAGGAQANHKSKVGTVQGWTQDFWIDVVVVWGTNNVLSGSAVTSPLGSEVNL